MCSDVPAHQRLLQPYNIYLLSRHSYQDDAGAVPATPSDITTPVHRYDDEGLTSARIQPHERTLSPEPQHRQSSADPLLLFTPSQRRGRASRKSSPRQPVTPRRTSRSSPNSLDNHTPQSAHRAELSPLTPLRLPSASPPLNPRQEVALRALPEVTRGWIIRDWPPTRLLMSSLAPRNWTSHDGTRCALETRDN